MGTRRLPLLVVTILAAMVAVVTLAIVKSDSTERLEINGPGPSPSSVEKGATGKNPWTPDSASSAPDRGIPDRPPESVRVEPPVERNGPATVDRDPGTTDLRDLKAELALLKERMNDLEADLREAEGEIAQLKAELASARGIQTPEEQARASGIPAPWDPAKLPKRNEFKPAGEMVDNLEVYKPTCDEYWTSLRLETYLHPEILRYRIKWSSGKWSPWFTPGVDDEDSKTNEDGSKRRIWSYFTDHEFQIVR